MPAGKRTVKWLYTELARVFVETFCIHQCDCTETTDIGIMQKPAVIELQA